MCFMTLLCISSVVALSILNSARSDTEPMLHFSAPQHLIRPTINSPFTTSCSTPLVPIHPLASIVSLATPSASNYHYPKYFVRSGFIYLPWATMRYAGYSSDYTSATTPPTNLGLVFDFMSNDSNIYTSSNAARYGALSLRILLLSLVFRP